MARRIRNANPVTLFPFLAVLMCTIGALVLLLVVISAQIRGSAVQQFVARHQQQPKPARPLVAPPPTVEETLVEEPAAVPEPAIVAPAVVDVPEPEPVAEPEPPVARIPPPVPPVPASDEQLAKIEALKLRTVDLRSKFENAVEEIDGLSQKRSALDRQLKAVAAREADLKKSLQRAVAVSTAAERQLASLNVENRQIIELLEQSDELIKSERQRVSTPRHSLIPYDGQTGTIRKPIIIECSDGTIRFEAEDVEVDAKRLEEYPPGVNPLVAGIQTLFAYWTEQARAAGTSGVAARPYALLIVRPSGADQFRLARVLLQSLVGDYGYEFVEETFAYDVPATTDEATRKCREAVEAAFRMKPRGPGVGSPRLGPGSGDGSGSRPNGGVILPRGPIDVERLTQRPAASRGFFSSGNFRRRLTGESPGEDFESRFASADRSPGSSSGTSNGDRDAEAGAGTEYSSEGERGSQGASQEALAAQPEEGNAEGAGPRLPRNRPAVGNQEGIAADSSQRGNATAPTEAASGRATRAAPADRQTTGRSRTEGRSTLNPAQRDDTPNSQREAGSTVAEFLAKARTIRERQQRAGRDSGRTAEEAADSQPRSAGTSSATDEEESAVGGNASNTSSESSSASGRSIPAGSSGGEVQSSGPGSPTFSKTLNTNAPRGAVLKRWGQSGPNATLGLERPVTMLQTVNVCLKGLDMTVGNWGMPGEKYYWVPVVTLRVEDGSASLGQLLEKSLERLGVVVEHEPAFLEPSGRN